MNQNENPNDFQPEESSIKEANAALNPSKPILPNSTVDNFSKTNNPFLRANLNFNNSNQNSNFNFNFTNNIYSKKPANSNSINTSIADFKFLNSKDYPTEINIFELGLSGIKEKSDLDPIIINDAPTSNNSNNELNKQSSDNSFAPNLQHNTMLSGDYLNSNAAISLSDLNNSNTNNDAILTELKSMNSTFSLWGFDFNLAEFASLKEGFYQRKILHILKALLLQKQSDDKANMEKARSLINLESQKRNLETQIEKINKNFSSSEEKLRKQLQEKDEKIRLMDKKLKEKDEEKAKILAQLESEKNENTKAKLKFSQLALQMKTKEKEFEALNQRLLKFYNNLNTNNDGILLGGNATNNVKICNVNLNLGGGGNINTKGKPFSCGFGENKEFVNYKLKNGPSFELKNPVDKVALEMANKSSFCYYVNTVLTKAGQHGIERSLIEKTKRYLDNKELNSSETKIENSNNSYCNEVTMDTGNISLANVIKYNNFNKTNSADDDILNLNYNNGGNFNLYPHKVFENNATDKQFYPSTVLTEDDLFPEDKEKSNYFQELSFKLFNLRLNAKNDALNTLEILYEGILQVNQELKAFALRKNKAKRKLKQKLFGTIGISKDSESRREEELKDEEDILKSFDNLIKDEKQKHFDSENALYIKNQILTNVKICEKLFFSTEELKEYQANPEDLLFKNHNFEMEDFQIVMYKNQLGEGYERVLRARAGEEAKELEKLKEEKNNQFNPENCEAPGALSVRNKIFLDKIAQNNFMFKASSAGINLNELNLNDDNNFAYDCKPLALVNDNNNVTGKSYFTNLLDELIKKAKEDESQKSSGEINEKNEEPRKTIEIGAAAAKAKKDSLIPTENLNLDKMDVVVEDEAFNNANDKSANETFLNNSNNNPNLNSEFTKIFLNEFSFNKDYFSALKNQSVPSAACGQIHLDKTSPENTQIARILIRNPARKLNNKIFENFTTYMYLCIKSNESYIDYFKMFLEEQKINLNQNMDLELNSNSNSEKITEANSSNLNNERENQTKFSKMFFYKNFQNMLLNLVNCNDRKIKEINASYAQKYEFIEGKICHLDKNVKNLQEMNKLMKSKLDYLDEYYERMLNKYGTAI